MPIIGTMSEDRSATRRKKAKKTMVPMKAKATEITIFTNTEACGKRIREKSKPRPAHSVVPVVVGSTKRFCVSSCITRPLIAMAAPARTRAMVRGTRVVKNMVQPSSLSRMLYSPTMRDRMSSAMTPSTPRPSVQVRTGSRELRVGLRPRSPSASILAATVFTLLLELFRRWSCRRRRQARSESRCR